MAENRKAEEDGNFRNDGPAAKPFEEEAPESKHGPGQKDVSLRPAGPDLILDERLTSAAAPFLYLLSIILIAVAGYFIYIYLRG